MAYPMPIIEKEMAMNKLLKALVAGAFTFLLAGTASAHGKGRVLVEVRPYYPVVQQHYMPAPVYYQDRYVRYEPSWEQRREWRREQWRRDRWRHDHGYHGRCRHGQWRR